ncbi:hypothetical protein TRFO_22791 [Tritrichomonas foetus]|uniref:Uncharacterized protein n=1 Tax=Tritrichomonas foetus TaxID=1144522 RepID=A0A1J4KB13_9EUKA|nr:hypothetical protein TRFO_22791 [Tritrichomonas foetus]|eukprot:OHT08607.1 hypothetical protein TRFO_22791 [Tritrichomonas foetus]
MAQKIEYILIIWLFEINIHFIFMLVAFLLCFVSSAKKITIKPNITSSAFNRTKGFDVLQQKHMVSPGKDSGVSGFAKTVNYYNHSSKKVDTASVWFVKGGTLMSDMICTVYRIDEFGNSFPILGPVTIPGDDYKTGYVLQPAMNHISGKYVLYFLHVTKSRMTFNEINETGFFSSPTVNSGMLQVIGKDLLSLEEDYILHAYIPDIGKQGAMIFRQPLFCVPADEKYYACIPLLSFDVESRTFSQVMIPDMLNGRSNKLQDPVYTITVDNKRRRVLLISKLTHQRKVGDDEVYKYQYIDFDCPIWLNGVKGTSGIPDTEPSYYSSYQRNLTKPNEVHFKNYEDQLPFSKKFISSKSSHKSVKAAFAFERKILFYQEASLSTHTIRTTNSGFCIGDYCTVPYQVPADWGRNGKYESQDNRADYSDRFGIRVIQISDKPDKPGTYVTHNKDVAAIYLDLREIANDQGIYSKFAGSCTIEFVVPPVTNENGVVSFTSLPLTVVYRCRQNFMTYTITIDPNQAKITDVEDDQLPIGVPADINFIPSREILYLFDSENPKQADFKQQTVSLIAEYDEVVQKYDNIAYFVGYDFNSFVHTNLIGQLKFIDRQVLQDLEGTEYKDVHIKLSVIPLPEGQSALFIDQIGKKIGIQSPRYSSSFEIVGVDNNKRSSLEWQIDEGNNQDSARYFEREFHLKNCDLTFNHPDAHGTVTVEMRGDAFIDNSRISMKNPNHTLALRVYNAISMDCKNLANNVKISTGQTKSGMRYQYKDGYRLFDGAGQSRYLFLGRNMCGISSSHPNEKGVRKIELTSIAENVVVERGYGFDTIQSNYLIFTSFVRFHSNFCEKNVY